MPVTLTLGDVTFDGTFECPQVINGGGTQNLNVHEQIGGVRVVDAMGRSDADIAWNGTFIGITAEDRVKFLNNMRIEGSQQVLSYSSFQYSVVIKSFTWQFKPNFFIDYQITCTVIDDQTQPVTLLVPAAFNDTVLVDLALALELAVLVNNPGVTSALALLNVAISNIPGAASNADLLAIASAAQASINALNQISGVFSADIKAKKAKLNPKLPQSQYANTQNIAAEIIALEASEIQAASAVKLQFVLLRILKNTQIALTATGNIIVQAVNTDLLHVAQEQYGDWSMYTVIAQANPNVLRNIDGFPDYFIDGVKQLIIPPKPSQSTNGIVQYA